MQVSLQDLLDRYSILELKIERSGFDDKESFLSEFSAYHLSVKLARIKYANFGIDVDDYLTKLYDINAKIWGLESDIRKGNHDNLGLEEVGRRAVEIRKLNDIRCAIKNEIGVKAREGYVEKKIIS